MESVEVITEEEDEILITLLSQHPLLYDLSVEDYRNTKKKDKVWVEIAKQLNKRSDSCRKRWKNMKDTYFRQKRKNKSGTGSPVPKNPRSKFQTYARLLSFLEIVPRERLTISNVETDDTATQESQISEQAESSSFHMQSQLEDLTENRRTGIILSTPSPKETPSPNPVNFPKCNKKRGRQKNDEILTFLQKREESRQKILENITKKNVEDEELTSFSDHVRNVLKKLPPILKIKAKKELFDVLMKYELLSVESQGSPDNIQANSPCNSSPYASANSPESQNLYAPASQYPRVERSTNSAYDTILYSPENMPGTSSDINSLYSSISHATTDFQEPEHTVFQEQEPTGLSSIHLQKL